MCARVFAQAEQRIFCTAKLQLNAIAICDAQARTRELGSFLSPSFPACPGSPSRGVSTNRPKKRATPDREENGRRPVRMTKDDRRQRTKKRMMTHMCIYAKPETDITEERGWKRENQWKGGGRSGGGRRTAGHRDGTTRYMNSLVHERRCFCDLRSAIQYLHRIRPRICENTNFAAIAREFRDFTFQYLSLSLFRFFHRLASIWISILNDIIEVETHALTSRARY